MSELDAAPSPTPSHPRWILPVVATAIVALVAANNLGSAVWACAVTTAEPGTGSSLCGWSMFSWINGNPIGLLALNSTNKYLLATSVVTDFWPFLLVATTRLLIADPLFYLLGYLYRGRALHWARRAFPGIDPIVDQFEADQSTFKKLLDPLVVIMPNNPVCLLAGVAAMPIRRFVVLNVAGTVGRVLLFRQIGFIFEDQITDVLEVVARYQGWFIRISILFVVGYLAWQVFGRRGLVGGVETLDEELGDHESR